MTITLSSWVIPLLITVGIWLTAGLWPQTNRGSDMFGIGALIDGLVTLALALAAMLVTWLTYFAWLAWSLA